MKTLAKLLLVSLLSIAAYATTVPATMTITVVPQPLQITTTSVPAAQETVAYTPFQFTAVGGYPPYTWAVDPTTQLPQGMQFTSGGVLSGTPAVGDAQTSPYTVKFTVTDNAPSGPVGAVVPPHVIEFKILAKPSFDQQLQQLQLGRSFEQISGE